MSKGTLTDRFLTYTTKLNIENLTLSVLKYSETLNKCVIDTRILGYFYPTAKRIFTEIFFTSKYSWNKVLKLPKMEREAFP